MLNRAICKKCSGDDWNEGIGRQMRVRGFAPCSLKYRWVIGKYREDWPDFMGEVPHYCPYVVEHVVSQDAEQESL